MEQLLDVTTDGPRLIIDARTAIRQGRHPRAEILTLVQDAPPGTLCEIHLPHRPEPLIAALQQAGFNVTVSEAAPGDFMLRVLKL
ncbi:DUF2249 domain-containing protein [Alicyclobacillus ferrooxydans]|uniref:Amino acid decarboxylase n=1 Tax=Alicyclobacillus ferrooxydans TaxID=471514 RepID=A0A0P9CSL4_9BACL|nr:DUF2249 domain-containing protein [Alicyclobacillus ferrooxydans]KPV42630.1 amino acid decarboxylase [Alicyclobacillus ferrooxydans]